MRTKNRRKDRNAAKPAPQPAGAGCLAGIKILDLTSNIAGPFGAMLLGDLGADVIKIETPGVGDPFRHWDDRWKEYSPIFVSLNRNKRSITLNLKSSQGKRIFMQLAKDADVVIESLRPGTVDALGIGYEDVKRINRRIVYCSVSAFGQSGPYREKPGYDTLGQALSGLLSLSNDPGVPQGPGIPISDHIAGIFSCYGVLAALMGRERTGKGQKVETSLLEATLSFIGYAATPYLTVKDVVNKRMRLTTAQVYAFTASDGKDFVLHLSYPAKFWESLTDAVGRPELRQDGRFLNRTDRVTNYEALRATLQETISRRTRGEWLAKLEAADVPSAPIRTIDEVFEDPQVRHLDMLTRLQDSENRTIPLVRNGVRLGATPTPSYRCPPRLGEHTEQVLAGLGYDAAQIKELRDSKAI